MKLKQVQYNCPIKPNGEHIFPLWDALQFSRQGNFELPLKIRWIISIINIISEISRIFQVNFKRPLFSQEKKQHFLGN